jgi:hypothetical protein
MIFYRKNMTQPDALYSIESIEDTGNLVPLKGQGGEKTPQNSGAKASFRPLPGGIGTSFERSGGPNPQ